MKKSLINQRCNPFHQKCINGTHSKYEKHKNINKWKRKILIETE